MIEGVSNTQFKLIADISVLVDQNPSTSLSSDLPGHFLERALPVEERDEGHNDAQRAN